MLADVATIYLALEEVRANCQAAATLLSEAEAAADRLPSPDRKMFRQKIQRVTALAPN